MDRLQKLTDEKTQSEIVLTGQQWPEKDESFIVNMGPQHPSTHGVLRIELELEGETILQAKPIIGYLHTGMEKTGEELTYTQGSTNVTRMDYASPLSNELVYCMAVEKLLKIEVPKRAQWIRMICAELNRISSHLLFQATNGMDLGAVSMMIYGWREREEVLRFLEKLTGLRMNHNFIRVGGVVADMFPGWEEELEELCQQVEKGISDYDSLLSENPIWEQRLKGVGVITTEEAIDLSVSGPILRSTGYPWDLRKEAPYLCYDEVDFDIVYTTNGDSYDRYKIRLLEVLESIKILRQCITKISEGDFRIQDNKVTPPSRERIDESMEALIHHFKIYTEGVKVPAGETYVAIESPRGEIGCYIVSDGEAKPYRMHIRGPSFYNLQTMNTISKGHLVADVVAAISSIDPIMGEVDR
jgi:NADH-quinone oxidoreductase subunit D